MRFISAAVVYLSGLALSSAAADFLEEEMALSCIAVLKVAELIAVHGSRLQLSTSLSAVSLRVCSFCCHLTQ